MKVPLKDAFQSFFSASDEQSMWRVQMQDDEAAFARLIRRWERPIQRVCIRMLGDPRRGEDLAQEAFLRVFAKRKEFRPDRKFSTWIWRIALNLCYDELRRRARRNETSLEEAYGETLVLEGVSGPEASPDEALAKQEQSERVQDALMRLPEIYRVVLVMRHYEDLKFREIAEVLQVPEGTIKSRMAEGLSKMRLLLESEPGISISDKVPAKPNQSKESLMI